ncbi:cholesterol 24-hydroxylase-like [Ylistrum balloti]|uniref:cholesterol 24-hydroxylase-like n=1 Tax=Ylistrum balloti TaxID=509963 RepID=UPI002905D7CF|nr:cholesterol 24-hydroxylase-like [Ylistrum balloti]
MSLLFVEIFGIVIAVCLCALVSLAWHIHRQHQKYDHLPGPPRDSFWSGNFPSIGKVISAGGIIDDYFVEMSKVYGLVFRICIWNQVFVIVLDPECIKDTLVAKNHPKSKRLYSQLINLFGTRFLGNGLETEIDNKIWILQRMQLDQWFKPHYIRQFAPEFNEFANEYMEHLGTYANGKTEIHMLDTLNKLTTHVLYKIAFSIDIGPLNRKSNPCLIAIKTALLGFATQLKNPLEAMNPFKWKFRREARKSVYFIRDIAKKEMMNRDKARREEDYIPKDLLEYILELKAKYPSIFTDEELLDNVVTFIIAGQETTANALAFMLLLLGQNPDCYKKLQREIDENIGAVSVITLNELEKLPYLDMVLKETLRLYPVAKMTFRETAKDCSLGGHCIPEGTDMLISFYATSRANQNVTDPTKFLPERFDKNSPEKLHKYASTPFSAGPHTCIGKKFAEIQMKIIIAKIMQNFDFELIPDQPYELIDQTTIHAKSGVMCCLSQRKTIKM